jgi:hypothetical protein
VLGASTLEEGGRMGESRLEEPQTEESDFKTKERQDRMQTFPAEHLEQRKNR